ncbi:hypothetical protein BD779DRAFT_1525776 [Infundibulicybe gibba]|nr:hypothetical protein BD779DRAFT_1525776 [Infundibulicybe gibba]
MKFVDFACPRLYSLPTLMRQSVAANRTSHIGHPGSSSNNAAAINKLLEKKKEYDAVSALERASAVFLSRIEGLGEDCETMADAGEVHGQVLDQWPKMFQILSLFLSSQGHTVDEGDDPLETEGQVLVRIPIEDLQTASQ